jgi:hypothetical protein
MGYKFGENQEQLLQRLNPGPESGYESGDQIVKNKFVKLHGRRILKDPDAKFDPNQLHEPYVVWDAEGGPLLVCSDDELYPLTKLEALMVRAHLMTIAHLDSLHNRQDCQGG